MKFLLLALSFISINASAAEQELTCPYKGSEQKLVQAVKAQLKKDILALKEQGIAVADSSLQLKVDFASGDRGLEPAWVGIEGKFRSVSGTPFELGIEFRPRDGMFGVPKYLVGYYSLLEYDELDREGNPVNGHCSMVTRAKIVVKNTRTGAVVAEFPVLSALRIK